jgi:mannosylglycoprotein endo-beta-mannosidase
MSLYADDAAVFIKPVRNDVQVVAQILNMFGHASGLITNRTKCAVYPIRCEGLILDDIMQDFQCAIQSFPCTYLGLPLHYRQLRRIDYQPLIDKLSNRLPAWKGRFLNRAARLKLLNSILSTMPVYFLTAFAPKKWVIKRLDRVRRSFLWKGSDGASGGHSLVCWDKVKMPKKIGGLGVIDLELFSRALRLRWLWYQWVDPDRPWVGTEVPCSDLDKQLFKISTAVTIGDGRTARFWESAWINGQAPRDIAPSIYLLEWRKSNTVRDDLHNGNWMRGLWRMSTAEQLAEFIRLWDCLMQVHLTDEPDRIR